MAPANQPQQAVLIGSRELAPGVRHFDFSVPALARLDFAAGQFVSLSHEIGGRMITRAYSISSAPGAGNRFSLCLNLVPDGRFSPFLFSLAPGATVAMRGPLGAFTLREPHTDEMIWVATGTGIAPFRGMLDVWRAASPPSARGRVTLVFGARYETGLLYREDFAAAAASLPDFDFRPTLSRPGPLWTGRRGHVQSHVLEAIADRRAGLTIYICGLKLMVDDLRARLKALGFDRKQIICEKFD